MCRFFNGISRFLSKYLLFIFFGFVTTAGLIGLYVSFNLSKKEIVPILSNESVENYLIFNYEKPNVLSAYLCNFFHAEINHLSYVIFAFLFGIIILSIIHYLESNESIIEEKPNDLTLNSIILTFLILPLLISLFSAIWGKTIGMTGCHGFSGIAYAFFGVFTVYLSILSYSTIKKIIFKNYSKPHKITLILLPIVFSVIIIWGIMSTDINPDTNYPGHIVGYLLGICFGYLFLELKI